VSARAASLAGRRPRGDQGRRTTGTPLRPAGNLRRRAAISRAAELAMASAAALAVALLVDVVATVVANGAPAISLAFLTQPSRGLAGGGIANALVGSAVMVALAAAIAIPLGVLIGLLLSEVAPGSRLASALELVLDMLQGLPTVLVGVFVFGLIVTAEHKETGLAGAVALSIIMLPLIARSSQQVLALVPGTLREAADALGVDRWRAVLGVTLPAAAGGIATGALLAIARAAGETAPLLLVDGLYDPAAFQLDPIAHGVPSVPMFIYTTYDLPAPSALSLAWGAALVLLSGVLVANIGARILLARSRRRMGL